MALGSNPSHPADNGSSTILRRGEAEVGGQKEDLGRDEAEVRGD
jgi:hypothetical protein